MSDQIENENQQSMTPEEVRQSLLAEIEATQQAVAELSNEQLEEVVGGIGGQGWLRPLLSCITCGATKPYKPISDSPPPSRPYRSISLTTPADRRSPIMDLRGAGSSKNLEHAIDNVLKHAEGYKRD